ncbi:hypothetical protein MMPV_005888 [Pyropia vietnamensis]
MDAHLVGRQAPPVGGVDSGRDAYGRPLRSVAGGRVGGVGLTGSVYPLSYSQQQQQPQQPQQQTAYRGGSGGSLEEPVNPQALGGVLDQIISPGAAGGAMLGGAAPSSLAMSGRSHEEMMSIMSSGTTTASALTRGSGGGVVGGGCGSAPGAAATRFYGRPPPPPVAYTASTAGPPLPLCAPLVASSSLTSAVSATACPPAPPKVSPRGVMGGFFEGDADGLDEQAIAEAEVDAAAAATPMGAAQPMYAWPSRGAAAPAADTIRHGGVPSVAAVPPPPPVRQTALAGRRPPGLDLPLIGGVQRPALTVPAWSMSHTPITPWVNDPPAVTAASAALPPPPPPAAYGPPAGVAAAAMAAGPSAAAARRRRRWELTRPPAVMEKKPYVNVDGVVSASELLSRRNRTSAAAAAVAGVMGGSGGLGTSPAVGGRGGMGSAGVAALPGSLSASAPGVTTSKMTDKERRVLRRLRNRESAERCRLRAVGRADETRRAAANLASENGRLAEEVARLSAEVQALMTDVVARGGSVRGIEADLLSG